MLATLPSFARWNGRMRPFLRLPYEALAALKNFFDQPGRGRFNIAPQHTFRTGGPEQYPRVGPVAMFGGVQKELHAVEILLAQDGISAELRSLPIGGAADGAVLDLIGNVQISPAIIMRAEFTLQVGDQLAERLPFFRHDVRQQERVEIGRASCRE